MSPTIITLVFLIFLSVTLRIIDIIKHRNSEAILQKLKLSVVAENEKGRPFVKDSWFFAVVPFVWLWSDIGIAMLAATLIDMWLGYLALVLIVAGRFRALQEVSHLATHCGLCASKRLQWFLGDILFTYPTLKADMGFRFIAHVKEHHQHANQLHKDPNVDRFVKVGLVPGISGLPLIWKLLYPLTPAGIWDTLRQSCNQVLYSNSRAGGLPLRLLSMILFGVTIYVLSGWQGLLFGYVLPLLTLYPFFSWLSVIAEHRWFVACASADKFGEECTNGRPTDYKGLSGFLVRQFVSPLADSYHLAHSLYPYVRWNYLPAVDRALKEKDPRYSRHTSIGLFFPRYGRPSAISEFLERITANKHGDLAPWARSLSPRHLVISRGQSQVVGE